MKNQLNNTKKNLVKNKQSFIKYGKQSYKYVVTTKLEHNISIRPLCTIENKTDNLGILIERYNRN